MTEFKWDQTDFIWVLEVLPEVDEDQIFYRFVVAKDELRLQVTVEPYIGDVSISLYMMDRDEPIFSIWLVQCTGACLVKHKHEEYLEIMGPSSFEFGRSVDNPTHLPVNVRIAVKPKISIRFVDS